jgi:hypothetical protein
MLKSVLSLSVFCMTIIVSASPGNCEKPTITFQNLLFGDTPSLVISKLKKFTLKQHRAKSVVFTGTVGGKDAEIFAVFTPKSQKLWKVVVDFAEADGVSYNDLKSHWNGYVKILTEKYGEPDKRYEFFTSPYFEGDGYETQALRLGKANSDAFWDSGATGAGGMSCAITKYLEIRISYEDEYFSKIDDQEKDSSLKDDL